MTLSIGRGANDSLLMKVIISLCIITTHNKEIYHKLEEMIKSEMKSNEERIERLNELNSNQKEME